MSEENATQIIPQQGATNETLIGDFASYFRWNPEINEHEIHSRINHASAMDDWLKCGVGVQHSIMAEKRPTVGQIIFDYNNSVLRADRIQREYTEFRNNAFRAISTIGERLLDEARDRGWCDEFDRIIDEVNNDLPAPFVLPTRESDYSVTWTETYTLTVTRSTNVTARSAEDAVEMVENGSLEEADEYELLSAVREGNAEFVDSCDFEAEEA